MIKLMILGCSYSAPMTWCSHRTNERGEGPMRTKVEAEVMQPQAKEHQGLLTASGRQRLGTESPSELPEGTHPADTCTSDSWISKSERAHARCLSHQSCGDLLGQPEDANNGPFPSLAPPGSSMIFWQPLRTKRRHHSSLPLSPGTTGKSHK